MRGIVRLSGPKAWELVNQMFRPPVPELAAAFLPRAYFGDLLLPLLSVGVPAILHLSRSPRSFTAQDLAEIHTIGSPPIIELVLSTMVSHGARPALPGEFTMRAFLNGKLDLTAAEAIAGLIDATNNCQAEAALRQMAGGIARPIGELREKLLDLLAELEAGLDFAEEDLEFIDRGELRAALEKVIDRLRDLGSQMEGRALSTDRRRVVLLGAPNVGKSSLFNALLGQNAALVSQIAGTTRDYLIGNLTFSDCSVELVDTAGLEQSEDAIAKQAQVARDLVAFDADLVLWCVEKSDCPATEIARPESLNPIRQTLVVQTKIDLARPPVHGAILVSAKTGEGLTNLLRAIEARVLGSDAGDPAVVASTAARCRQSIRNAQAAANRALVAIDARDGDDLIALELRLALDDLAQIVGAVYTDDILDRIFSRFCIGK